MRFAKTCSTQRLQTLIISIGLALKYRRGSRLLSEIILSQQVTGTFYF